MSNSAPGGAGVTSKAVDGFPKVLEAALKRVATCECDIDTSCYARLRSYSNQAIHRNLQRGIAFEPLECLAPSTISRRFTLE
ncbi:DUF1998 domain-containing protein [Corynebacterium phocae]|uniref:DUF1998 domain-containing protein n=1 Tax=Corynebacterium phocae TaxID=161895 RepID=UPI000A039F9C|nr:DUF1998 domain-containing protein [Corynebacterium phocae]